MEPPYEFGAFLRWLRDVTERAWEEYHPRTLTDYRAARMSGADWQRGTRWTGGLWRGRIADIEKRWRVRFPPDYRLFLGTLHATDRPLMGAQNVEGDALTLTKEAGFYNWEMQERELKAAFELPARRVLSKVQRDGLWKSSWGKRPASNRERQDVVRRLVKEAPKLIPIIGRRYLLSEPSRAGNAVVAVRSSGLVFHAGDMRQFLLKELSRVLPSDVAAAAGAVKSEAQMAEGVRGTPFWGELIELGSGGD